MLVQQISVAEAKVLLLQSSAILVDIRDEESYNIGHDEQATNLTMPLLDDFIENTEKCTPIIVLCYHGISSFQLAQALNSKGFENVYSVEGGYESWKEEGNVTSMSNRK